MDLDFRGLAGPWIGRLRLGEYDLRNVRYSLQSRGRAHLLSGLSADGRIELYANPGRYRLSVVARPMEDAKTIEIEIGNPTEQIIDAAEPMTHPSSGGHRLRAEVDVGRRGAQIGIRMII